MITPSKVDIYAMHLHKFLLNISLYLFMAAAVTSAKAQTTNPLLKKILSEQKDSLLQHVLAHPEIYHYQIIYTQINRDKHNTPSFKNYYNQVDSAHYFYPASTVKLPLAILALEKLHSLKPYGVDVNTAMQYDSSYSKQTTLRTDTTSESGYPSIAHFIKKVFLISDNDAYNRLYEFVGQQTINRRLHAMAYKDLRITRQFLGMSEDENRHTNAIRFITPQGKLLYSQPAAFNQDAFNYSNKFTLGQQYYKNDSLIRTPMDFTKANNLTLYHLQGILQSVLFPQSVHASQRFQLDKDDYDLLYRYLSQYPSETNYPKYDSTTYYDSYVKFFFNKGGKELPSHVRVFNKVGWAYGCMTDVSYIVDFKNNVEFMLTATVYVNSNEILNDDDYDYETVGLPFFYQLGQALYQYDAKRPRRFTPDLSRFKMEYGKQRKDGRAAITHADN